jgi:hypothetical protein
MMTIRILALNFLVMGLTTLPLFAIEHFWGMAKHWVLSSVVWLLSLAAMYIWLLPWLGLEASPEFWRNLIY